MSPEVACILFVVAVAIPASFFGGAAGVWWGSRRELRTLTRAKTDLDAYVDGKMRKLREERQQ